MIAPERNPINALYCYGEPRLIARLRLKWSNIFENEEFPELSKRLSIGIFSRFIITIIYQFFVIKKKRTYVYLLYSVIHKMYKVNEMIFV